MELLPLVCLCLLSCSGDAVRVVVEQDSDAVLPCLISNKENLEGKLFDWRKDGSPRKTEVFMYDAGNHYNNGRDGQDLQFKGRVSFFQDQLQNGNASIKITGTKKADSGNYSCDFPNHQPRQTSIIELVVDRVLKDRTGENISGAAPKPSVTILAGTNHWALLQCEAHGDPLPAVEWRDSDDNTLPTEESQISERGGRYYITVNVTVTKADRYSCVATQEKISHQVASDIYVPLAGAASKPSVTILDQTEDWSLLQCEVLGASPKPKVEWKDSSGNILPVKDLKETERGDSYDIVLQTTVTKTDRYRCVVTQEEINHQIHAETLVTLNGSNTGLVATIVVLIVVSLLLVAAVVVAGLYIKHLRTENRKKDEEKREPQTEPNSSTSLKESS